MAVVRKKQDDKNLKILREIVSLSGNKQCFDCNQKGPTYVNMTIGSFVCTRCSGVLRGLTPPHRVKSISMATFSSDEIEFIKAHGNKVCAKTWLGLWDPKRVHSQDQRELMIDKYERKRYYLEPASPLKSITNTAQLTSSQKSQSQNGHVSNVNTTTKSAVDTGSSALWSLSPPITSNMNNNRNHINRNGVANVNAHSLFTTNDNNGSLLNSSNHKKNNQTATATNGISLHNFNHNNFNNGINLSTSHNVDNGLSNGINGHNSNNALLMNGLQQNVITKNSLNLQQTSTSNSENHNKFTPDADFVADFSTASIFNATTSMNNTPIAVNNGNGNGNAASDRMNLTNGVHKVTNGISNGNGTDSSSESSSINENFADFEHNTIYNAAAVENQNNNYFNSMFYSNNDSSTNSNNNNNNNNNSNSGQWNVWQQFQWPYIQPDQNRWSLPMSLSSTSNSLKSSGTFNSNSSINSTPSVDRYAALKDLDEQLREIKDTFNTQSATVSSVANPFSTSTMPSTQPQQIANPFQVAQTSPPTMQNLWMNGSVQSSPQQQQFAMTNGNGTNMYASPTFTLNGSPYNGVQQYQKLSGNTNFSGAVNMQNGYQQKNPFATPVLNATTNPFL